ncbi:MAG TPA: TonB-dependent receptor [Chitinophagaceae bacterium]|nr:TonB-dependent receptor [Chitinophagaceae bacterium]
MKKLLTLLILALAAFGTVANAQVKPGKINGTVIDGNTKTIESATITLLRAKDSSVAKMSVADKTGKFSFESVAEGKYFVSITAVGHMKGFSETIEITAANPAITLKTIELIPAAKTEGGVTVVGKRPLIEQKLDRTIVNVEASVTNVGASALEVLEKSPGVTVDKDCNISLKGKQGVKIYVDGRPSYLSGADLANLLRNMNANQLDQIEIMTNPPAKYDAAGNSGIINIKMKKSNLMGYSGSLSLGYGQGRYSKINESGNFNYRKNKVNLFANVGYSNRKNFQDLDIQRKFIDAGTKILKSYFDQESRILEHNESINGKVGFDYFASKKTTIGGVFSGFSSPGEFSNTSDVLIYDENHVLQSITRASTTNDKKWKNFSGNLNFRHVYDSTGKEITADIDYLGYRSKNDQRLVNSYFGTNGQPNKVPDTLLGNLPQNINIFTAKIDYSKPLKGGAKFEMGAKTSFVKTDNNAVYDSVQNGLLVRDIGRSNHFIYTENVNAAYVNYSRPLWKKFSGQFGLRLENTNSNGNQVTSNVKFIRHYTQLFPTIYIQYDMNKTNTFVINYGRRISRPDYEDLNPFILFLDKYTFEQGNPDLQPQFSHNIELSHTYKGFLTTTLNYSNTTDIITEVLEQNTNENQTFIKQSNIAKQRQYGIAVSAGGPLTKWWTSNLYVNVYNNLYKGIVNGDYIEKGGTTGLLNISNQFKFGKTWAAEVSGFYRTPAIEGIFKIFGIGQMNIGLSKQIMKGKGSVRFSLRDVFMTNKARGESRFSNIDAEFQQKRDSRVATLNFTWRFSKGKTAAAKRRASGASDESSRVKTGTDN